MVKVVWNAEIYLNKVNAVAEEVGEEIAEDVMQDAKRNLANRGNYPNATGKLSSEIDIRKSKFKDGGHIVQAQGTGNYSRYYASFVERGSYKDEAKPFMGPALKKHQRRAPRRFAEKLERI